MGQSEPKSNHQPWWERMPPFAWGFVLLTLKEVYAAVLGLGVETVVSGNDASPADPTHTTGDSGSWWRWFLLESNWPYWAVTGLALWWVWQERTAAKSIRGRLFTALAWPSMSQAKARIGFNVRFFYGGLAPATLSVEKRELKYGDRVTSIVDIEGLPDTVAPGETLSFEVFLKVLGPLEKELLDDLENAKLKRIWIRDYLRIAVTCEKEIIDMPLPAGVHLEKKGGYKISEIGQLVAARSESKANPARVNFGD